MFTWQHRVLAVFIGVSGCFCVLFGAWLAHAGGHLSPEVITRLETAHQYHILHTLALLGLVIWRLVIWRQQAQSRLLATSSWLMVAGIWGFSGSLYFKTLLMMPELGQMAPFGGVSLALAWLCIAIYGVTGAAKSQRIEELK
ncbi:DUF423 domain-containing protein [Thalassotalea euphylliae]|uniref:DUF423 domain-containing protein n=1 Tax=Thalassotalea euphylliae TaxID=1655234 RepID=A0A3E0UHH6_9GAMM|nr:DUF423 domain-containing protein [Thalassotalea euphylliae]REL35212.1 DUF423 domain-containing protein [Thalassotalea euphylliae]